jgi:hypothetical protein
LPVAESFAAYAELIRATEITARPNTRSIVFRIMVILSSSSEGTLKIILTTKKFAPTGFQWLSLADLLARVP